MKHPKSAVSAATYLVFFLPWIIKEHDAFVRYHQRQAIILTITGLAGQGIISILGYWMYTLGLASLSSLILVLVWVLRVFLLYLVLVGIKHASIGETRPLPWIGRFADGLT